MPVVRLTDITVRALKPTAERITCWDETIPGFGVRVGRRAKVFIVMHGKARKRVILGHRPRPRRAVPRPLRRRAHRPEVAAEVARLETLTAHPACVA